MPQKATEKTPITNKALTIVGAVLCVILIPILVINVTLIIVSYVNTEEVPNIGGYAPIFVLTGSMEPEIKSGDLIIVKQIDPEQVQKYDVISFFDPALNNDKITTHQVIEIIREDGALFFRTQGTANNAADAAPVPAEDLVGIYRFRIPGAGNVAIFMQTTTGLVVCVLVPLVLLVLWDVLRRRQYEKRNQQDTDALLAELEALKAAKAAEQAGADSTEQNDADSAD